MNEVEALVNSLRAMELPKGAESLLSSIVSKHGALQTDRDGLKTAFDKRESDNKTARDEIKDLKQKVSDLEAKVPDEGAIALPKSDADALAAYRALGTVEDLGAAQTEAKTLKRNQSVAEAAGRDYNAKALGAHLPPTATLEPKKTTVAGKETTVYEVVDGDTRTGLEEFVKAPESAHDYVQFRAAPQGVQVLPQVVGDRPGPDDPTKQTRDTSFAV